jgi:hypothetical protein
MNHLFTIIALVCSNTLNAQLLNSNFDTWGTNGSLDTLTDWRCLNQIGGPSSGFAGTKKDTNLVNNSYAVTVHRWYHHAYDMIAQSAPIVIRPDSITGYYWYKNTTLVPTYDTALIVVRLTRWNYAQMRRDTVGYCKIELDSTPVYKRFSSAITYIYTVLPDTVTTIISPSKFSGPAGCLSTTGFCSYLTIDDLRLIKKPDTTTNVVKQFTANHANIYPNPNNGTFTLQLKNTSFSNGTVTVYDVVGKEVYRSQLTNSKSEITLNQPKGIYFVKLQLDDAVLTKRVTVE